MWRKALLTTLIWFLVTTGLNMIMGWGTNVLLNSDLVNGLGLTTGEFLAIYGWFSRIIGAILFFLIVWWALRSSTPQRKQKRAYNSQFTRANQHDDVIHHVETLNQVHYESDHSLTNDMETATSGYVSQTKKGTR